MFQKPFQIKSQTVLKGSERKKLRTAISQQSPSFTAEILSEVIPQKSDVQSVKVLLHSGDRACITLAEKQPVFFEISGRHFPTVYTAWKYPDCLTTFATWPHVIQKLYGGADLMLPGVVFRCEPTPDTLSHISKEMVVGVSALGNKTTLVVGETCMNGMDMYQSGFRGKGVYIKHFYGDQLWAIGTKVSPPAVPEEVAAVEKNCDVKSDDVPDVQQLTVAEDNSTVTGDSNAAESFSADATEESDEVATSDAHQDVDGRSDEAEFAALPEDEKLKRCFLFAMKKKLKKNQLPLLTPNFYRDCIIPCCPDGTSLDLKKTSYKKLNSFLTEMQKQGFLVVKETSKGCHSVIDFDPTHPEIRSFKPWQLEEEDTTPDDTQIYQYKPPEIVELLAVNAQTFPLFSKMGLSKGSAMNGAEMRQLVTDYIKQHNLQHTTDRSLVVLDEVLTEVLVTKKDGYVENMKWNEIFKRLNSTLGSVYEMRFPTGAVVSKKGSPTPIQVKIETRSGNKKVTLIKNLDKFGLDCQMVAKDLRSAKACSATVQDQQTGPQVLAQGNHARFVHELLKDTYKIPIKYLDIPI